MDSGGPEDKESNHVGHSGNTNSSSPGFHNDGPNLSHTHSNKNDSIDGESQSSGKNDLSSLLERVRGVSYNYSYLDHPADVILLGEGESIREALQSISVALFNYMSDLSFVDPAHSKELEISGRGLLNLLYHLLDECLYLYSSEYFIAKHVLIEEDLSLPPALSAEQFNNHTFTFRAVAVGDYYNKLIHRSGTEIKAITMHYLNFNFWLGGRCYEYKNDMESHENTLELLSGLAANNHSISRCSVYCLVDI
ncbi:hypothetical protein MACJ_002538 [Theileria orientalis]|uniref:Archease domain-containing protein n=1 Tax=Theileria orientalis TaxID=68886 RepID=A0A976M680_THEOR|nr:hypothetical protein MACJ_002538 [Theileria orientalis]